MGSSAVAGVLAGIGLLLMMSGNVAAQAADAGGYPARPVSLVVPYAPGGGHDSMARMLAERLGQRWRQAVVVENKAGANGMIGAEYVARSAPDGYTILFASPAEIVIAPTVFRSMRYDPVKDLVPVTLAGVTPLVLVANPAVGVKTLPELIALARKEPGRHSFGTAGSGSSQHLAGAWLNQLAGIDLQHVPYKGAGPATNDVLGGQIPFAIVGMAPVLPHIKAGKLVPVAVMTPKRVRWAADVPTVAETAGMQGFTASHWMGVFAAAGTPAALVARLQSDIAAVLVDPGFRERLTALGVDAVGSRPEAFARFLAEDRERFATMFGYTKMAPQ